MKLEILYEDPHCLVINKPAGVAVLPGYGMEPRERTILADIEEYFKAQNIPFSSEAVLVHRLDKDTTGCLLVAKDPNSHDFLQKQFETRTVLKTYLALVKGIPKHTHAIIDAPIGRNIAERTKMGISGTTKRREAQTEYRVLKTGENVALLKCTPKTGRTHQIRVHLKSIGHPIVGDKKYGTYHDTERTMTPLCLHAWKLSFDCPSGIRVTIEAPIPDYLNS